MPDYSVHDIARIGNSKAKLLQLIEQGVLAIGDVPEDAELSDTQRNQVRAAQRQKTDVDHVAIREILGGYAFPLSFFDYETYAAGVPRFVGYRPFDQIPFQFSLDVMRTGDGEIEHYEFLWTETGSPDAALIQALRLVMPRTGSIVS